MKVKCFELRIHLLMTSVGIVGHACLYSQGVKGWDWGQGWWDATDEIVLTTSSLEPHRLIVTIHDVLSTLVVC